MHGSSSGRSRTFAATPVWSSTTGSTWSWTSAWARRALRSAGRSPATGRSWRMRDAAQPVEPSPIPASAPVRASRHWVAFLVLAAGIVIADQLAKAWVVATVAFGSVLPVFGDYVRIWHVHNTGALFGLFRDQAVLFAALSIGVVALIIWFHGRSVVTSGWLATLALGLLLGGAR